MGLGKGNWVSPQYLEGAELGLSQCLPAVKRFKSMNPGGPWKQKRGARNTAELAFGGVELDVKICY